MPAEDVITEPETNEAVVDEAVVDEATVEDPGYVGLDDAEPSTEEAAPAELSAEILSRAKSYGLDAEDLAGLDDSRLQSMFAKMDRRSMGPSVPKAPAAPKAPITTAEQTFVPFELKLDEFVDESIATPLKGIVEHLNGQMKEVHSYRQRVLKELNAINTVRAVQEFDRYIESLGGDWSDKYGSGSTLEMDSESPEFQSRLEIYTGAEGLVANSKKRGSTMMRRDSWERSHRATNWDRIADQARKDVGNKVDRRVSQFAERPTRGTVPAMTPREAAIIAATPKR